MKRIILFLMISINLLQFNSCKKKPESALLEINLELEVGSPSEINCTDFIKSFEYIPLETNDSCLIGKWPTVNIVGDEIVVQTRKDCMIFEKGTGKFKTRIAKQGRGPGEYQSTLGVVDSVNEIIFFQGSDGHILEYSFQNVLVNEFQIPDYDDSFETPSFPTEFSVYKNWLLCYFTNSFGNEEKLIMAVDRNTGRSDFIIPNKNRFGAQTLVVSTGEAAFYSYSNNKYFIEDYNDTIFVLQDSILAPRTVIHTGKYHYSYEDKWDRNKDKLKLIRFRNLFESDNYLYFDYSLNREVFLGLYSKSDQKLKVASIAEGITNDVDNFVNFTPNSHISDNTVLGIVDAYKVSGWFSTHKESNEELPEQLQKLKNINENDNPVVMIAKLKE